MDTGPEQVFEGLTSLAARVTGSGDREGRRRGSGRPPRRLGQ
ncbi:MULTISPECIES: hypothetical protein [unclassified Streptomyces]|nr:MULTISPECIES: hypothetical protein [unclassified Streptomyces]